MERETGTENMNKPAQRKPTKRTLFRTAAVLFGTALTGSCALLGEQSCGPGSSYLGRKIQHTLYSPQLEPPHGTLEDYLRSLDFPSLEQALQKFQV